MNDFNAQTINISKQRNVKVVVNCPGFSKKYASEADFPLRSYRYSGENPMD